MVKLKIFGESVNFDNVEKGAGKGIHFIVNGWTLSAQAGWGNYCSEDPTRCEEKLTRNTIRTDCEIALWKDENKNMIELNGDNVMGWVSWDMVFDIIEWLRKLEKIPTTSEVKSRILKLKYIYKTEGE